MLKITITREFASYEEAAKFIGMAEQADYGAGTPTLTINVDPPAPATSAPVDLAAAGLPTKTVPPVLDGKKPRKPRADAGKPRGPYKADTNAKPEGAGAPADTSTPATPAPAATSAVAPQAAPSGAASPSAAPEKPASSDSKSADSGAAVLTIDDMRAKMSELSATRGKGMEACIAALKAFGVLRISDLPAEKYAEFAKHVADQLPAAR